MTASTWKMCVLMQSRRLTLKKISDLSKEIADTQQQLIGMIGGFDSDANVVLENLMDLYNQRMCKLLEAVYILGASDAETYL